MLESVKQASRPLLEKMVAKDNDDDKLGVTYVIADGLFDFAVEVGNNVGIPVVCFDTVSPCCLWVLLCLPRLIQDGQVPIKSMFFFMHQLIAFG